MSQNLRRPASLALVLASCVLLSGCATWSAGSVERSEDQKKIVAVETKPADVIITEGDITNRAYTSLGDITVAVNKTTVFNKQPTKEQVNEALKTRAAKLGADAVIFVRYGDGGMSLVSWGSLEGKGRAVKFKN